MLKLIKDKSTKFKEIYELDEIYKNPCDEHSMFQRMFRDMVYNIQYYFGKNKEIKNSKLREKGKSTSPLYHFIPLGLDDGLHQLHCVKEYIKENRKGRDEPYRFLDAGCGPGNIIMQAQKYDVLERPSHYHGIELDKKGASLARILLRAPITKRPWSSSCNIWNTDIVTFKYYKKYDVIYYYCPISHSPLQSLFEEILEDKVKVGTIIMPNLKQNWEFRKDKRFKQIAIRIKYATNGGFYSTNPFIQKISEGKRCKSSLTMRDKKQIPKKYHKIFMQHMAKIK